MMASTLGSSVKSLVRDAKNRIFYENAENLVRDATSSSPSLPTPHQLHRIGQACMHSGTYPLVWNMLYKRLTHLPYKRHVLKALLVLDFLIRLAPPSIPVQLRLIVDVREHWHDIYRLARLRVQSSSETIQQIQRIAERLCAFIWRVEQGEIEAGEPAEDEGQRRRRKPVKRVPKRKKRAAEESSSSSSTTSPSSSSDSESEMNRQRRRKRPPPVEASEGKSQQPPPKDLLSPSRIPNFGDGLGPGSASAAKAPAVSPFGFDFGSWSMPQVQSQSHTQAPTQTQRTPKLQPADAFDEKQKNWSPNWRQAPRPQQSEQQYEAVDWNCNVCTYLNPSDQSKCVMCASPRPPPSSSSSASSSATGHAPSSSTAGSGDGGEWTCRFCSFRNPALALVCHVCDHLHNQEEGEAFEEAERLKQMAVMNTDGSSAARPTIDTRLEGAQPKLFSPPRSGLGARHLANSAFGISCSWCQYLNPPTAVRCEICDKSLVASAHAQQLKLQMAQKQQLAQASADQKANLSWQCTSCTHINPPGAKACVRCRFNPSEGKLPDKPVLPNVLAATTPSIIPPSNTAQAFNQAMMPRTAAAPQPAPMSASAMPAYTYPYGSQQRAQHSTTSSVSLPVAMPVALPVDKSRPSHGRSSSMVASPVTPPKSSAPFLSPPAPMYAQPSHHYLPPASSPFFVSGPALGSPPLASSTNSTFSSSSSSSLPSSRSHSRHASMADGQPDDDLLQLLVEQQLETMQETLGALSSADMTQQKEQAMREQMAAMEAYTKIQADMKEELKQGKWSCTMCSYMNAPNDSRCEMCQYPRPSATNPFADEKEASRMQMYGQPSAEKQPAPMPMHATQGMAQQRFPPPASLQATSRPAQQPPQFTSQHAPPKPTYQQTNQQQQQQQQQSSAPTSVPRPYAPPTKPASVVAPNPFDLLQPLSPEHAASPPASYALSHVPEPRSQAGVKMHQHQHQQQQQQQEKQHPQPAEWSCERCTFDNPDSLSRCEMCDAPRPAQPPKTSPQPAASSSSSSSSSASASSSTSVSSHAAQSASTPNQPPLATAQSHSPPAGLPARVDARKFLSEPKLEPSRPRSAGASPDPYSALLAHGMQHSTLPRSIATSVTAPPSAISTPQQPTRDIPQRKTASPFTLAPPSEKPQRHRGSASQPGSRQASISSAADILKQTALQQQKRSPSDSVSNGKSVSAVPSSSSNNEPAFDGFDPSFPVADAFSHLYIEPHVRSPPNLQKFPDDAGHQRQLSFNSMFNANSDMLAKQIVGAIPRIGPEIPAENDAAQQLEAIPGEAEDVGPGEDEEEAEHKHHHHKRTKEEKEARRKEKEERRARKEKRRAERAAKRQKEEEERLVLERAAMEAAMAVSLQAAAERKQHEAAMVAAKEEQQKQQDHAVDEAQHSPQPPPRPTSPLRHPPKPATPPPPPAIPSTAILPSIVPSPSPPPIPPRPKEAKSPESIRALAPQREASKADVPDAAPVPGAAPATAASPPVADLRQKVIDEIKSTERIYVNALFDVLAHFMEPMKRQANKLGISAKQISLVFSNLSVIAQFHAVFLQDLERSDNMIVEVFVQLSDFMKMYTQYCSNYEKSIATINSLRANSKFTKMLEEKRDLLKGRGLMSFLIMPVQRIPRYVLLLRELKRHTPEDHPELPQLSYALDKIEHIANHVNESKRHVENMSKLLDIQNRIQDSKFVLFKPDRRLLREGQLRRLKEDYVLNSPSRPATSVDCLDRLFFLFNDALMWTSLHFDLEGFVDLCKLTVLPTQFEATPHTLSLAVRGQPFSADMVFLCKDGEEEEQWRSILNAAIHTATEYSLHGVRILPTTGKGRGVSRHSRTLSASSLASISSSTSSQLSPSPAPHSLNALSPTREDDEHPTIEEADQANRSKSDHAPSTASSSPHAPSNLSDSRHQPHPPPPAPPPPPPVPASSNANANVSGNDHQVDHPTSNPSSQPTYSSLSSSSSSSSPPIRDPSDSRPQPSHHHHLEF